MKDPPWGLKTEECSICYVSLLEGTHNFWKLQENYNLDSTLQGILMYWPMHVLRQQQFLPLLGHLHSHLMVKLWCNWGSHGFHTDWFLLGVTMISSKLAQSLWIMSLWCQFCCKKQNLSGMSPDGKFQRCSVFQHVVVLTCFRALSELLNTKCP